MVGEWVVEKAAMWAGQSAHLLNAMRVVMKVGKLAMLMGDSWVARMDDVWADSKGGHKVGEWVDSSAEKSASSMAGLRVAWMAGKMALRTAYQTGELLVALLVATLE